MLNSIIMSEPIPHSDGVPINDQDKRLLPPGEREKRESYFRDIIGLSQDKIDRLKEKHSSLYSTESIIEKVNGLKDRGFTNPNKTIESSPQILGLAFENIDAKINLLSKLTNLYQLNLNPVTTIESNPTILSVKLKKLIVITRVLRDYQSSPEDIQRKVSSLYKINLESLLISYSQKEPNDNIDNLIRTARQIQKQKLSKDYKRQLIKDFFNQNTDSYKIYREYLKGYPEKTQND